MNSCEASQLRQPVCSFGMLEGVSSRTGSPHEMTLVREVRVFSSSCSLELLPKMRVQHVKFTLISGVRGESSFRSKPARHRDKYAVVAQGRGRANGLLPNTQ